MPREVNGSGPIPAKIMVVGEAPGAEEEVRGVPFIGASGHELDKMLGEAGISRAEVFVTNVCRVRPPDYFKKGKRISNDIGQWISTGKGKPTIKFNPQTPGEWAPLRDRWVKPEIAQGVKRLLLEIELVRPNVIIPVGNLSMWALTGRWGISKWRGSMLLGWDLHGPKIIPTFHPAYVLRSWSERAITVSDLRRAARFRNGEPYPNPGWQFGIRPTFLDVQNHLAMLYDRCCEVGLRLVVDIETSRGHIDCIGIAWNKQQALCIPLMCKSNQEGYWSLDEEACIVWWLWRLMTHPKVEIIGQNFLYDCQYIYRHWHFTPRVAFDTMIGQHAIFSDLPKALAYLASMYSNFYIFWKEEGKSI